MHKKSRLIVGFFNIMKLLTVKGKHSTSVGTCVSVKSVAPYGVAIMLAVWAELGLTVVRHPLAAIINLDVSMRVA